MKEYNLYFYLDTDFVSYIVFKQSKIPLFIVMDLIKNKYLFSLLIAQEIIKYFNTQISSANFIDISQSFYFSCVN